MAGQNAVYRQQQSILLHGGLATAFNEQYVGFGSKGADQMPGILGQVFTVSDDIRAQQYTDSQTTHPLYAGNWRVVRVKTGVTVAFGEALYWDNRATNVVTNVTGNDFAGIAISVVGTALFCIYMCDPVQGLNVTAKFLDTPTKAVPAAGDVVVVSATTGRLDVLADATAVTWATNKPIGTLEAAIDGTSHLAKIKFGR